MRNWLRKTLVGLLSMSMAFIGVVAAEQPSQALDARTFDPGLIISDAVFNDWGTMTAAQIQKFLEARVPTCTDDDGGPKCLRNYKENVIGTYAIRSTLHSYSLHICADVPAATNQTGAQIIYSIAVACRINPRVLIVTLQKEQGLITAADPTTYMYKAAMGYGCPDSAPQICGQDSNAGSRLFYQMYRAAWQLRWYGDPRGSFTYLKPGNTISMGYHPSASCGKKSFKLKSQATAKLYYYTPYTPNTAALNNLWGTGDGCSAYGNRNFWRTFWTWFGSPVAGSYLLKSSSNQNYLVNQDSNKRYLIADEGLVDDFSPLGPIGTISDAYMASFADSGELKPLVQESGTGKRYLIRSGFKYQVDNLAEANTLGLDWAGAPVLTPVQISNFPDLAFYKSISSGELFLLEGTTRHLVSTTALYKTLSVLGGTATVSDEALAKFTLAEPATELLRGSDGTRYVVLDGKLVELSSESQATALGYNWNAATLVGSSAISSMNSASFVKSSTSATYYLQNGVKRLVTSLEYSSLSKFGSTATVSPEVLSKLQTGAPVAGLIRTPTYTYYISGGYRYRVNQTQVSNMNSALSTSMDWNNVATATSDQMKTLPAPVLMQSKETSQAYLVVDYAKRYPISAANLASFSGLGGVGSVPSSYLTGFVSGSNPDRFVQGADGYNYMLAGSKKYRIASATVAREYAPATFTGSTPNFDSLPELSAAQLALFTTPTTTNVTNYVKSATERYLVQNGQRREILDDASLAAVISTTPGVSPLTPSQVAYLPLGTPVVADGTLLTQTGGEKAFIISEGRYHELPLSMLPVAKSTTKWQLNKSAGVLSVNSIAKLASGAAISPFVSSGGTTYILTETGKLPISNPADLTSSVTELPQTLLAKFETVAGAPVTVPFLAVSSAALGKTWMVGDGAKRHPVNAAQVPKLLRQTGQSQKLVLSSYVLDALTTSHKVFAPGEIVRSRESGNIYFIDGLDRAWGISAQTAKAFGVPTPVTVARTNFSGYATTSKLPWLTVKCGANTYLADGGQLLHLDSAAIASWPGSVKTLKTMTCANLNLGETRIGNLVNVGNTRYLIESGKRRLIRTTAEYNALASGRTPSVSVTSELISMIPAGNPTSYVVVSGNSLAGVAAKFNTTKLALRELNGLTTETLRVGQVLRLP